MSEVRPVRDWKIRNFSADFAYHEPNSMFKDNQFPLWPHSSSNFINFRQRFPKSIHVAFGQVGGSCVTKALRLTIVSAVCATSQRARDINIPVTRPFRKPWLGALFSPLAVQYWWWVDISRSRIWNLIAAFRPQFEFHEILSTKPIRSYTTDLALRVHVSKGHTYIDSWKVLERLELWESEKETEKLKSGAAQTSTGTLLKISNIFQGFFPFPFFFVFSFFFLRMSCVCAYLFSWKDFDLSNSNNRCDSSGIERATLLPEAVVWLYSWLYYYGIVTIMARIFFELFEAQILNNNFRNIYAVPKFNIYLNKEK